MQSDLVVPAFELDCRGWIVAGPEEHSRIDDPDSAPIVLTLSTAVVGEDDFYPVSGEFMLGLLDDVPPAVEIREGGVAAEIIDNDDEPNFVRYLLPCPDGSLALMAAFDLFDGDTPQTRARVEQLMASFRWTDAGSQAMSTSQVDNS